MMALAYRRRQKAKSPGVTDAQVAKHFVRGVQATAADAKRLGLEFPATPAVGTVKNWLSGTNVAAPADVERGALIARVFPILRAAARRLETSRKPPVY